ncbi:MAG: hypothetical protein HBSAPP03_26730 [Phycisphaerae bacterium]|nr:MAG: hypothetical protein HBSAPP03_26730 [Phycisphaerae bacterium]
MLVRTWLAASFALLATLPPLTFAQPSGAPSAQPAAQPSTQAPTATKPEGLPALDGEWIFLEDKTVDQPIERLGPPMSSKMWMRVDGEAVILNGHGSGHKDVRVAIDGTTTEIVEPNGRAARYTGSWKDGTFEYEVRFVSTADNTPVGAIHMIRRSFRMTPEGLIVRVSTEPTRGPEQVGLYRHAEDIPMPTPAKAVIADVAWISGAWVGTRSSGSSIEERWSPPLGGAMLAVSRSVNTSGRMNAFEYLRILEREGGLVYAAQPGGAKATEFVLTELGGENGVRRAVFENPRHDYPKRIVYELSAEGGLSATIGNMKGGTPRVFEFRREEAGK